MWMLNSTVSSRLLNSMATVEGFQHEVCEIIIDVKINYILFIVMLRRCWDDFVYVGDFNWLQVDGE